MTTSQNTTLPCRSLMELKIRSRILLKAAMQEKPDALNALKQSGQLEPPFRHKDGLKAVSRLAGFKSWQHASHVLGGSAQIGEDMGELWYDSQCGSFLNIWCRNYEEARDQFERENNYFLFPYKTQFVVTNDEYVRAIGFQTNHPALQRNGRDFIEFYGSSGWDDLTFHRLQNVMGSASSA
ncbi:hypothetical protein [Sneathiella litorea]|uniref:Uncharacterized protein n=1 Tax=Sneathiella litorea TaxID=2606216 RepID=A0A6L8W8H1_9PROT|nr:hypothetical protein [Sneathiella litorea]MZR31395.1 hypothetical protein [Sneathiella litorea]